MGAAFPPSGLLGPPTQLHAGQRELRRRSKQEPRHLLRKGFLDRKGVVPVQSDPVQVSKLNYISLFFLFFLFVVNLSYIEMNQPWVYMCSPSRELYF